MPISSISLKRPINSYAKFQAFKSLFMRGNKSVINFNNIKNKVLLNVGCGPNTGAEFINLDYYWSPGIDICWDIAQKPYPLEDNSLEGIYTEHCLEHIPYESCRANLKEFHRLLKPGGVARVVVPDAEIYFDLYERRKANPALRVPYSEAEATPMVSINRLFRSHGHQFIYDYETLSSLFADAGFTKISKQSYKTGQHPKLLIDQEYRAIESLYIEAIK